MMTVIPLAKWENLRDIIPEHDHPHRVELRDRTGVVLDAAIIPAGYGYRVLSAQLSHHSFPLAAQITCCQGKATA